MMDQNNPRHNKPPADTNKSHQPEKNETEQQTIAQNPNPRANKNIRNTPFEKETDTQQIGSEITDGEDG